MSTDVKAVRDEPYFVFFAIANVVFFAIANVVFFAIAELQELEFKLEPILLIFLQKNAYTLEGIGEISSDV